jgi:SH3 domain protein
MHMRLAAALLAALAFAVPAAAETLYVSDLLTVPLRSGPSLRNKILHAGLPSGTPLEVLATDEDSGFTQVRLRDGMEGWVRSQYLTAEPIARIRLANATRQIEALQAELASARSSLKDKSAAESEAEKATAELEQRAQTLEAELTEIKSVSAGAMTLKQEKDRLEAENSRLAADVARLTDTVNTLEQDVRLRWLLAGGALVLAGLLIGVFFRLKRKRSFWA